ncbi:MAG: hypothetical protein ACT4OX_15160 [Actinomycetota bacterium]
MTVGDTVDVAGANWAASDADTSASFVDAAGVWTSDPVPATVDASGGLSAQLTARFEDVDATAIVVEDATGDPATHRATIPIDVKPQEGLSGKVGGRVHLDQEDPSASSVEVRARVIVTPPANEGGPLPPEVAAPVGDGCAQLAAQLEGAGADPLALTTACNALTKGGGGSHLQLRSTPQRSCVSRSRPRLAARRSS